MLFSKFFQQLLAQGIYWPPSQFEAAILSVAHSDEDIRYTIGAIEKALNYLQS
jgi:glutamate-1-semialdehyde 2,1-aminomutase